MRVIAIHGKMLSGKSTTAQYIQQSLKAVVRPFAAPIKDFATQLGWDGEKGPKGRRLLQLLGTEVGRECISDTIWVDKWHEGLDDVGSNVVIICDDLRFQNEYEFLDSLDNVTLVHVIRPVDYTWGERLVAWLSSPWQHQSERGIDFNLDLQPIVIHNTGTLSQLHFEIDRLIDDKHI